MLGSGELYVKVQPSTLHVQAMLSIGADSRRQVVDYPAECDNSKHSLSTFCSLLRI